MAALSNNTLTQHINIITYNRLTNGITAMLNHFSSASEKDANFNAFNDLEYNNIAYYIYFVATGNVKNYHSHAGHFISIKSNRKLIKVNSTPNTQLIKLDFSQTLFLEHSMKNTVPIWQQQAF